MGIKGPAHKCKHSRLSFFSCLVICLLNISKRIKIKPKIKKLRALDTKNWTRKDIIGRDSFFSFLFILILWCEILILYLSLPWPWPFRVTHFFLTCTWDSPKCFSFWVNTETTITPNHRLLVRWENWSVCGHFQKDMNMSVKVGLGLQIIHHNLNEKQPDIW